MSVVAVAAAVAVAAGAALQSAVGFGFALVCAPLLYAALSPEEAVGLLVVLAVEVNLLTLLGVHRRPAPSWPDVRAVVAWSLPGALAGVAILRSLDDVALQLLVTAGVLLALVVNLRSGTEGQALRPPAPGEPADLALQRRSRAPGQGARPSVPRAPKQGVRPSVPRALAGLASGALNTSTSTGGPPVVLLLMGRGLAPVVVRDTLVATFLGFAPVTALALVLTGTEEAIPPGWSLAVFVPLTALGTLAGRRGFAHLSASRRRYERALTAVLLAAVAAGLASVL
jgi:uncharacterized membrane protein YfcA